MSTAALSSNLHTAIRTIKKLEAAELEGFFKTNERMKSMGLTGSEEKALSRTFKRNGVDGTENYWA